MRAKTQTGAEFPKARSKDVLTEEVGGELLVFDTQSNRAHCLNGSAAAIWQHCDGKRSLAQLAQHLFPDLESVEGEQLVRVGVERLRRRRLLEGDATERRVDLSKRHMIKKMAIVAAAAGIAAPIISSVVAPTSSYAFSCLPRGMPCSSGVNCCSGSCVEMICQ
jgi:hypothetical protein